MSVEYLNGARRSSTPSRLAKSQQPKDLRGKAETGRIVSMLVGQCCGTIRLANARKIYFHRADVREGTAFNDLRVGDDVTFELLDDEVSGARALRVARRARAR